MNRLDSDLRDACSLTAPYCQSDERWGATMLLGTVVGLNAALVGTNLGTEAFADQEVAAALHVVDLGHLAPDLDTVDVWERRLSGGEQQRLMVARSPLNRPDWLFLDEPTSALDVAAEERLYSLIGERLPRTTIISIAHRPELVRFHSRKIVLKPIRPSLETL